MVKLFKKKYYPRKLKVRDELLEAQREAEYLASPKGLAIETIKGIPTATKKVGRAIKEALAGGLFGYGKQMEKRYKKTPEGKAIMESLKTEGFLKTLRKK